MSNLHTVTQWSGSVNGMIGPVIACYCSSHCAKTPFHPHLGKNRQLALLITGSLLGLGQSLRCLTNFVSSQKKTDQVRPTNQHVTWNICIMILSLSSVSLELPSLEGDVGDDGSWIVEAITRKRRINKLLVQTNPEQNGHFGFASFGEFEWVWMVVHQEHHAGIQTPLQSDITFNIIQSRITLDVLDPMQNSHGYVAARHVDFFEHKCFSSCVSIQLNGHDLWHDLWHGFWRHYLYLVLINQTKHYLLHSSHRDLLHQYF